MKAMARKTARKEIATIPPNEWKDAVAHSLMKFKEAYKRLAKL